MEFVNAQRPGYPGYFQLMRRI